MHDHVASKRKWYRPYLNNITLIVINPKTNFSRNSKYHYDNQKAETEILFLNRFKPKHIKVFDENRKQTNLNQLTTCKSKLPPETITKPNRKLLLNQISIPSCPPIWIGHIWTQNSIPPSCINKQYIPKTARSRSISSGDGTNPVSPLANTCLQVSKSFWTGDILFLRRRVFLGLLLEFVSVALGNSRDSLLHFRSPQVVSIPIQSQIHIGNSIWAPPPNHPKKMQNYDLGVDPNTKWRNGYCSKLKIFIWVLTQGPKFSRNGRETGKQRRREKDRYRLILQSLVFLEPYRTGRWVIKAEQRLWELVSLLMKETVGEDWQGL